VHRLLVTAAAGLLTLGVLAGCSSDSKAGVGKVKVDKNGATSTVTGGQSAVGMGGNTLPPGFPRQAVPLPKDGMLQAVIASPKAGRQSYSLSYGLDAASVVGAAKRYKDALKAHNYRIESSASAGAAAVVFSAFTAVGPAWDVVVYSGGSTETGSGTGFPASLGIQVTTHNASKTPGPNASVG
jgi:hypothetical protein